MKLISVSFILASASSFVAAHGNIVSPIPRVYGSATRANCGSGAFNVMTTDITSPVEFISRAADSTLDPSLCQLNFCRGAQFSDNTANVNTYTPGQIVDFKINLRIRHTGIANVSIVDTQSRAIIGSPLVNWPVYASTSIPAAQYPKNETEFSVTIPTDLPSTCTVAGACAIQWYWYGASQTYENCVDFIIPACPVVRLTINVGPFE